jgi:hypothetical protein
MDIDGEDVSRRLHVKFVTKLDSPFKVPVNSVAIPSNVTRLGLSSIVNSIIESGSLFSPSLPAVSNASIYSSLSLNLSNPKCYLE